MVERESSVDGTYESEELLHEMRHIDSLPQFRVLLTETLPEVPVDAFVYDFAAQIELQELFGKYAHKTRTDKETPVIILKEQGETDAGAQTIGGTKAIEPYRFRLKDDAYIYYFNEVPKNEPLQIRFMDNETQIFPTAHQDMYPLNRVPVVQGTAQRYDYKERLWVPNGQGIFRGIGAGNRRMGDVRLPRVYGQTN